MASEQDIIGRESGGDPNVGYSGVDLSKAPLNKYGFPIWSGAMGPEGISHAAGLYQFEPKTWEEGASALGITDFSPQSQKKVYDYIHGRYGDAPWAASAPGGSKLQPEGYYGGSLHINVKPDEDLGISPEGAALLSSILQQHYPSEDKSTGNSLLDGIMQSQVFGFAAGGQEQKPLNTKPLEQATPHVAPPQTVPELQEQQVVPQPLSPLSAPAVPPPAQSQQPAPQIVPQPSPQEFVEPPAKGQQVPPPPVQPQAAPRPVIQPSPAIAAASLIPANLPEQLKKTGNAILDHILSSPKRLVGPHAAASLIGNLLTQPDQRLGADVPIEAQTPEQKANALAQAVSALPRELGGIVARPFQQAGEDTRKALTQGIMPEPLSAAQDVALAGGGIGRGGFGAGPRLPRRIEPPTLSETAALGAGAGTTRLYRGIGGGSAGTGSQAGGWFTTDPAKAALYGKVHYVDVTRDDLKHFAQGHGGPDEFITDNKDIIGRAKPLGSEGGKPPTEPPSGTMPPATPMPPPKGVKAETQALDDDLFRAAQSAEADRLEAQQLVDKLPADLKGEADEKAYHERESRMTGKPIKPSSTTERIEKLLKPLDDKIHEDATWIREHAEDIYKQLKEVELRTAEQGYVHRKIAGQKIPGEMLDPQRGDIISGLGGGLSRRASGLMHRTKDFVLEDNAGNRIPGKGPLVGQKGGPARYGETITDPRSGVKYTVKEPTTAELEARYPQRKYVKSLLANTIDNSLRLSRVRRNVEILEKWKPQLQEAGHWMPENAQADHPRNFVHVDVPQMRGWAEPHIASVLNDIYRTSRDDIVGMLEKANKFLIGTMFSLPVRHQLNVAAHYAVGRGFDWVYRNPQLARAYTEVATQGPNYLRYLRAGAGLRYATTLNENFYNTLLSKLFHDQMNDPEWAGIFKELGHKAADVVRAEYAWSRRALWKVNDVFLTARIMELEKAGKPLNEAIKIAEDEIPNYRLPTNNLIARKLISSPYIAFGRYGYGRASALAKTAMNLVGPNATGEERLRALGQALIMVVIGTEGYKIGNAALNGAQQQINQALGPKWGPRVAGAKPLTIGGIGPFGPTRATAQYIGSQLGLNDDEKGWASLLGSWISLAPAAELPIEVATNRNTFTGLPVVNENASSLGKMVQFGEAALGQLNPVQLAIESARKGLLPGIGPQFGVQQEYKGPPGKIQRMLKRQAGRQEARDPIEQAIKGLLGR